MFLRGTLLSLPQKCSKGRWAWEPSTYLGSYPPVNVSGHLRVTGGYGSMTPVTAAKVKYGVWGLICGAIIAMIIGFAWGGSDHLGHDDQNGWATRRSWRLGRRSASPNL